MVEEIERQRVADQWTQQRAEAIRRERPRASSRKSRSADEPLQARLVDIASREAVVYDLVRVHGSGCQVARLNAARRDLAGNDRVGCQVRGLHLAVDDVGAEDRVGGVGGAAGQDQEEGKAPPSIDVAGERTAWNAWRSPCRGSWLDFDPLRMPWPRSSGRVNSGARSPPATRAERRSRARPGWRSGERPSRSRFGSASRR